MELIYSHEGIEQGMISQFTADFEESTDVSKNTFEVQIPLDKSTIAINDHIYENGTELGGIVDSFTIDTSKSIMSLEGRTWRGVLGSKILEPPSGSSYYTVSGDANTIIADIIEKVGLGDLFVAEEEEFGETITWQFDRYTDAYTGLVKMLSRNGLKPKIVCDGGVVTLSCEAIVDYSDKADITSNSFSFKLSKKNPTANHMIGLGSGELSARLVCHKYLQADGTVGNSQFYTGVDEVVAIYDYPNCESSDELEKGTTEELLKCAVDDSLEVSAYEINASICDKFLAIDETTGISVEQYVVDKIITATELSNTKIQYKVGGTIL